MDLKTQFDQATRDVKKLPSQSNPVLLQLYALFKQATSGDVSGTRPGIFDMRARAKYDAWSTLQGKSSDQAMQEYIQLVKKLSD